MDKDGNGKFTILCYYGKKVVVDGSYAVNGEVVSLSDQAGKLAHTKPEEKTGTYKWKYAHGSL